jgi:hypothetical protein
VKNYNRYFRLLSALLLVCLTILCTLNIVLLENSWSNRMVFTFSFAGCVICIGFIVSLDEDF